MVTYTDQPVNTRRGAPRVHIPDELAEWCERTYRQNIRCEVPLEPASEEAPAILRALRIYANRQNKAISHEFTTVDGRSVLRFQMRDRKRINRVPLPKET